MRRWLKMLLLLLFIAKANFAQNRVLELNGAGDFVELPSGALSNVTTATIEAWVNWRTFDGANKRVFNYGSSWRDVSLAERNDGELWLVFPEDRLHVHDVSTRHIVVTNIWYHLAGVIGADGMKLYLNGWLLDSNNYTGGFNKTLPTALFRIGETVSVNDPPAAFEGMIDEVRLWNTVRTAADIRANLHHRLNGDEPGLIGLWNFDDDTAKDKGPNGWNGAFRGKAHATQTDIPSSIGIGQTFLEARIYNSKGEREDQVILEVIAGTNLLTAKFSQDAVFKMVLPASPEPMTLRAYHIYANTALSNVVIAPGGQAKFQIGLPPFVASLENTNQFVAALHDVLTIDPTTLEQIDASMMLRLSPFLHSSEKQMLTLFESRDVNRRRFIALLTEKFPHSSLPIITALAKARHDRDEIVRGLAQRALQNLPVPAELEAVYTKRELATASLFAGLLIPFALIHFFLFILHPPKTSNLYYGLFSAAGALMIYYGTGPYSAGAQIASLAFMLLGLLALYSLFYLRLPWNFWATLTAVGLAMFALFQERNEIATFSSLNLETSAVPENFPFRVLAVMGGGYLALAILVLDMLRVVIRSVWRGQEGAWLVGAGFLILIVGGIIRFGLYFALFGGKISADTFAKYIIYFPGAGAAGFVICGSIYLAKSFSQSFGEVQTTKVEIEKKNAELTVARDVALSANQTKSQFLANMSHELRTPLNAIIGYSELVAEVAAEEGHKQYLPDLEKVTAAARHQLMLVNDILDLSKIEAGKMTVNVVEFDVKAMIHEIRNMIAPLVAKKRNRLEIDCPGAIGKMRSDETKVRQVLFNLLSNAAKFTEDGSITLRVAETKMNGAPAILFEVTDTGIGMTGEQVGRLFQSFTQAETSIHQKYGGSGLGLVISRRFCEMMGGGLIVRTNFGKGSTFVATLPATMAQVSP
jgi:signal transduction histidine kinase